MYGSQQMMPGYFNAAAFRVNPAMGMGGPMPFPNQMQHHMAHQGQGMPGMPPPYRGKQMSMPPPPSNYVAPADNVEYQSLEPGQAKVMKGYVNRPLTDKGRTLMETYERVMARPQGSFPHIGPRDKKECHFFNSPGGCRNGDRCMFAHVPGAPKMGGGAPGGPAASRKKCRNFPNCKFGTKCRFLHTH